jgi:hypothetical protein
MRSFITAAVGISMLAFTASLAVAQGAPECQQIPALMAEREKTGKALMAANKRKADVKTACGLFKSYVAVEAKALKFLRANQTQCGVPAPFLKQFSDAHVKTTQASIRVCQAAANGGGGVKPPSAGLSNALGVNTVGGASDDKPSAVFDTLHGNVLAQ